LPLKSLSICCTNALKVHLKFILKLKELTQSYFRRKHNSTIILSFSRTFQQEKKEALNNVLPLHRLTSAAMQSN
jgi:hypothetical protein